MRIRKIKKAEYWGIAVPDFPLLNVSGLHAPFTPRVILRITLDDGAEGWSEIPCNSGVLLVLRACLASIIGLNADIASAQRALLQLVEASKKVVASLKLGDGRGGASFDRGVTNHVRAGVQMAWYDALARSQGLPLCDLLGGENGRRRSAVNFNLYLFYLAECSGAGLNYDTFGRGAESHTFYDLRRSPVLSVSSALELATVGARELLPGVKLLKWKLGVFDPNTELDLMLSLADKFPSDMKFVPDPNAAWNIPTAVRFIRTLKEHLGDRLPYFEDPVSGQDAMAEVHAQTGVPLATNMCASTFAAHEEALAKRAIQITLGGDCHYIGGSDEAVRLSHWCVQNGIGFGQHSNTHLAISLMHTVHMGAAAAVHEWPFDSHYFPWQQGRDPLIDRELQIESGGTLSVNEEPGIGMNPSFDGLLQLHEIFLKCNLPPRQWTDRDDGPAADLVYGGWIRPEARTERWFFAGTSTHAIEPQYSTSNERISNYPI